MVPDKKGQKGRKEEEKTFHKLSNAAVGARVYTVPNREAHATQKHGAHCVTNVVLFGGTRRGSADNGTCGNATWSLCRSRSKEAGTAELRAESDDVDERIGEARFRT